MSTKAGKASLSLFKQAWNDIPDIVIGSGLAILGLCFSAIGLANYYAHDGDNRRYKLEYVVIRSDDPRASKVHKD